MRRRDFLVLGGTTALFSVFGRAGFSAPVRWIDVHLHVIGGLRRQFGQAVDQAVVQMDAAGIAKAIVFPPPSPQLVFDYPAYAAELRRYPGRFGFLGGGGLLNSMLQGFSSPDSVTPEVRQRFTAIAEQIADAGAVGYGGRIASLPDAKSPVRTSSSGAPSVARPGGDGRSEGAGHRSPHGSDHWRRADAYADGSPDTAESADADRKRRWIRAIAGP